MRKPFTFKGLTGAGFGPLLPIVPHDAQISSRSKSLKPGMLGKTPGVPRDDGWVGLADWTRVRADPEDMATWQGAGAGIGLICENVVAVDIDVLNVDLAELIQIIACTELGFAPCRIGKPPKRLLLYRLETPGSWPTKVTMPFLDDGEKHLVELLGARQQFVVESIHPDTGKPYSWDSNLEEIGLTGLPTVTPEELNAFLEVVRDTLELLGCEVRKAKGSVLDGPKEEQAIKGSVELVAQLVAQLPNGELNGYDDLATMAHAIWAACADDREGGLEILLEWAGRWPLNPDLGEAERIYQSIKGSRIGIQWLQDQARQHGVDTASTDFEEEVAPAAPATEKPEASTSNPDSFWERYVYVNQIKRFVDLLSGEYLDKEQFNDRVGKLGDNQTASTFFMEYRREQQFCTRMDYRPGVEERVRADGYGGYLLNAWRPGPAHSKAWNAVPRNTRALDMWLQLAEHLFPNTDERDALLDWMAYLLQKPGNKPNWHPLIGGHLHGTGKDSLFIPLCEGLGDNMRTIRTGDLEDQWTWWAENVQLVVVSEINSFERRAVMNRLKSFMANPPYTVEINKKGMPQYEVPNLFGMVMFTNNEDAVAIEFSDRRFFVIWTDAGPLQDSFYQEYHSLFTYSATGPATVVDWLLARDISGRDFQGRAPETGAKETMRLAAMPAIEGQLLSAIENEEAPFNKDIVTVQEVELFAKSRSGSRPISPQKLGIHLRAVGAVNLGRTRLENGERARFWAVRRVSTYAALSMPKLRDLYEEKRSGDAVADFLDETGG